MANLRATSRRTNFKKYKEQIFVKNIQSQKEKNKMLKEANSLTNLKQT